MKDTTISKALSINGRKGGFALANKLTPEQRSASARHAASERWKRYRRERRKANGGSIR